MSFRVDEYLYLQARPIHPQNVLRRVFSNLNRGHFLYYRFLFYVPFFNDQINLMIYDLSYAFV